MLVFKRMTLSLTFVDMSVPFQISIQPCCGDTCFQTCLARAEMFFRARNKWNHLASLCEKKNERLKKRKKNVNWHWDSTAFQDGHIFFFFCSAANAEVILRLIQQQPRTREHQQWEEKEERERCLLLAIAIIVSLLNRCRCKCCSNGRRKERRRRVGF